MSFQNFLADFQFFKNQIRISSCKLFQKFSGRAFLSASANYILVDLFEKAQKFRLR